MTVILTLGGVIFDGFEVPNSIPIGGDHALVVHKLPGGSRTIDAMGADHRDRTWTGRFRGADAESRVRIIESFRNAGRQLLLQWSTFRYQVLIAKFEPDYQQPFEIPYSITCTILADESAPILTGIPGIDELIGSDLGTALGLSDSLNIAAIGTAMTTAQQAITSVNTLKNAPASTLSQIASSLGAAEQVIGASITAASGVVSSATPIVSGGNPAAMASSLTSQASAFGQLNQLYQLSGTVTRMAKNVTA